MGACSGYKANLAAAGESDTRLEARLAQNMRAFSSLSLDNAVALMPRLQVAFLLKRILLENRRHPSSLCQLGAGCLLNCCLLHCPTTGDAMHQSDKLYLPGWQARCAHPAMHL